MSTIHHRTRIRAIRTSSLTAMAHNNNTTRGRRSTTRGRRFSMKALQNPTTRTCSSSSNSSIITPQLIDHCRC